MPTERSADSSEQIIVVLGGTNGPSGRLSPMCVRRLRQALALYRCLRIRTRVVLGVTGGYGEHFNTSRRPHWWYSRRWLLRHGVKPGEIRFAMESLNTPEDGQLTALAFRKLPPGRLHLVTSDFHARRVQVVFAHFLPEWQLHLYRSRCLREFTASRQQKLHAHERRRVRSYLSEGVPETSTAKLRGRVVMKLS